MASMSSDVLLSAQSDNSELNASDPVILVSGGEDNLDESTVLPSSSLSRGSEGASFKTCAGCIVLCCTSDSIWPAESPMETIDVDVYFGNSATQTHNFVNLCVFTMCTCFVLWRINEMICSTVFMLPL